MPEFILNINSKNHAIDAGAWKKDIPKLGPTPVFLSKYDNGFWQYWSEKYLEGHYGKSPNLKAEELLAVYKT